jgi:hypothetical protein
VGAIGILIACAACLLPRELRCWDAESSDAEFLAGLRQRRLYELAQRFCELELSRVAADSGRRAFLVTELVRTLGEHSLNRIEAERDEALAKARLVAADYLRTHQDDPRRPLVQAQEALAVLAMAELQRIEAEVGAAGADLDRARTTTREANRLLQQIEKDLGALIVARGRKPAKAGELSQLELTSLLNNVRMQLARSERNLALTYERGSPDRLAVIARSFEPLRLILSQLDPEQPLAMQARLDEVIGLRHADKLAEAEELLQALAQREATGEWKHELTGEFAARVRAERIRLALARGHAANAREIAGDADANASHAELDFARLELIVALWKAAEKSQDAVQTAQWQRESETWLSRLEQRHGPYWRHRGELLVVRSASSGVAATNLDLLARSADNLYLNKQLDEAVAAYDKAAAMAGSLERTDRQFELAYRAAAIRQQQREHADAARRFRELSLSNPEMERSAAGHLLAVWNTAQLDRDDPGTVEEYERLLREHLENWPVGPTAEQTRVWLAAVFESRRDWREAIRLYEQVTPSGKLGRAALLSLGQCWLRELASVERGSERFREGAEHARRHFDEALEAARNEPGDGESRDLQRATLLTARLHLQFGGQSERGEALLQSLIRELEAEQEAESVALRHEAESLLLVAIAANPERRSEAAAKLERLSRAEPSTLFAAIDGLSRQEAGLPATVRRDLAQWELQAIDALGARRQQLGPPQQIRLDLIRAAALLTLGKREQSLAEFARLAKAQPNDGTIQEAYAQVLLDGGDAASWKAAIDQWRLVASRSPPQSERWFRARHAIALAHFRNGDRQLAAQLIHYLLETPPGIPAGNWRKAFEELLAQCENRRVME